MHAPLAPWSTVPKEGVMMEKADSPHGGQETKRRRQERPRVPSNPS